MGWSIEIQLVRDRPLTDEERARLDTHARGVKLAAKAEPYRFSVAPSDAPGGVIAACSGKRTTG